MFEKGRQLHIVHEDPKYAAKFEAACEKPGVFDRWNFSERAKPADRVIVYLKRDISSFIGTCTVGEPVERPADEPDRKRDTWFHVRDAQRLRRPVRLDEVTKEFHPNWAFAGRALEETFPIHHTSPAQLKAFLEFLRIPGREYRSACSAIEGQRYESRVMRQKRNRGLRDRAIQDSNGICEACRRDYSKLFDGRGERVLQAHHREQLSRRIVPEVTCVEDLAVVCGNCHLLIHMDPKQAIKVEILRQMLIDAGQSGTVSA